MRFRLPALRLLLLIALTLVLPLRSAARAQVLNWEGQTGLVFTPTAAVTPSEPGRISWPAVAFQVLSGGDVIGTRFQISLTSGLAKRVEIGYTRSAISSVEGGDIESLFDRGFSNIHGKVILLEARSDKAWPSIAAGAIVRWQKQHIEGGLGVATQNADVYVVATHTLLPDAVVPVLLTGGFKMTNAAMAGIAGNAPDWTPCVFGAAGVIVADVLTVGVEGVQQPSDIDGFADVDWPATISVFGRVTPASGRFSVHVAFVRLAGEIAPGIDVKATNQFLFGASVRF